MDPEEYKTTIAGLGWTQVQAAAELKVNERTSRRWASGDSPIPESVALYLRMMLDKLNGSQRRRK